MIRVEQDDRRLRLENAALFSSGLSRRLNLQIASPVLFGLTAPVIVLGLLQPSILQHATFLITLMLGCSFLVCVAIYIFSVLTVGETVAVTLDRRANVVEVLRQGPFAQRAEGIALDQVARAEMAQVYDRDGYATLSAQLDLRGAPAEALPEGTHQGHIEVLNAWLHRAN
ncbi:MAG: hypothetical protein AAFR04_13155 [Pseudomonadota bacterium]